MADLGSTNIYGDLDVKNNNIKQVGKINDVTSIELSYLEGTTSKVQTQLNGKASNAISITAGNGLTGGGTLAGTRTITLGTPTTVTNATTNSVTSTGHTHALSLTKADITALGIPASDTNTTYSAGTGLTLSGTVFTPTFGTTSGTVTQGNDSRLSNARTPTSHIHGNITNAGAIGTTANRVIQTTTNGVLTAKAAGTTSQYLRGDGSWATPPNTNTTYEVATTTANGLMSSTDKTKLNGVANGANNYTHPTTAGNKHIPTGGSVGQILKNTASGTATWQNETNTITTINGKTGAISKADIVALGIPSSDTNTTYSAGTGLTLTGTTFTPTFGTTSGTICQGNDSRLSNARTPLAHSHDYLPLGGGVLTGDMSIFAGNTDKFITFDYNGTNSYAWRIGYLGTGSGEANYLAFQSGKSTGTTYHNALRFGLDSLVGDFAVTPTVNGTKVSLSNHTHNYEPTFTKNTAFNKNFGTTAGTVCQGNDSRLSNARTPLVHTHGNITNAGAIGTTANRVIQTTTNGVLTAKAAGTTSQYLRGDGSWATPPNTNTTYSAMSVAEGTAGTVTSSRVMRADYLKQIIQAHSLHHISTTAPSDTGKAWIDTSL